MKAGELERGFWVDFIQTGRTARAWDDKSHRFKEERLPDRKVAGEVTTVAHGKRTVQISMRTPDGKPITAHLPTYFDVGKVKQGRGPQTRWRCADRCGEGEWMAASDVPEICPECGAGIDIEKEVS